MKTHATRLPSLLIVTAALFSWTCAGMAQQPPAPAPAVAKLLPDKTKVPELPADDLGKIQSALPAKAAAEPKQPRKILVFWRCEGFFHGSGIAGGNKALELMGRKTGAFEVETSRDYEVFEAARLAKFDAVILNNTTGMKFPHGSQAQALLDYVHNGKGLVGIHAATDNFKQYPELASLMGGLFDGHPWGGGGTWAFKLDEPDHPLNRAFGGRGFKLKDEIYQFKEPYTRADRRVLLSLDLTDPATGGVEKGIKRADKDFAVAWAKQNGKGRVFYCSLGHAANVFQDPAVLQFYLDGIQWAIGDLQAEATPLK